MECGHEPETSVYYSWGCLPREPATGSRRRAAGAEKSAVLRVREKNGNPMQIASAAPVFLLDFHLVSMDSALGNQSPEKLVPRSRRRQLPRSSLSAFARYIFSSTSDSPGDKFGSREPHSSLRPTESVRGDERTHSGRTPQSGRGPKKYDLTQIASL